MKRFMLPTYIGLAVILVCALAFVPFLDIVRLRHTHLPLHSNGLIYSDSTIGRLRTGIDSMQQRFESDTNKKAYYALPQADVCYVRSRPLRPAMASAMQQDIKRSVPYGRFVQKYKAWLDTNGAASVVRFTEREEWPADTTVMFQLLENEELAISENASFLRRTKLKGNWLLQVDDNSRDSIILTAFFFIHDLHVQRIPPPYEEMLRYADYMLGTSASIYLAAPGWLNEIDLTRIPAVDSFHRLVSDPNSTDANCLDPPLASWNYLDGRFRTNALYRQRLQAAVNALLAAHKGDATIEKCAMRYGNKKDALTLMRWRRVTGMCSRDAGPSIHMQDMAVLAAETRATDIFLRAHLNLLNDRSQRMSDNSYAVTGRPTYIRELEQVDVRVPKLLPGIILCIYRPAAYHYYGVPYRVGRAIAESTEADTIAGLVKAMATDTRLDKYNRQRMMYLYLHYLDSLDSAKAQAKLHALKQWANDLPPFLKVSVRNYKRPQNPL